MMIKEYPHDDVTELRQPCILCGAENDIGEVCVECAKTNDPYSTDLEASGGWAVQDGRPPHPMEMMSYG